MSSFFAVAFLVFLAGACLAYFVLPKAVRARLAIEAGMAGFWQRYTGLDGEVIGMTGFGESAPAGELFKLFGFTVDNVLARARALLAAH